MTSQWHNDSEKGWVILPPGFKGSLNEHLLSQLNKNYSCTIQTSSTGESTVLDARWTHMRPIDEVDVECIAGSECCYPQKDGRPGIAFGYWSIMSINFRACSKQCAEKVAHHIYKRFSSMDLDEAHRMSQRSSP